MAVDLTAFFTSYEEFGDRVDEFVDRVHSAKPASGVERVRVPGDDTIANLRVPTHNEARSAVGADRGPASSRA